MEPELNRLSGPFRPHSGFHGEARACAVLPTLNKPQRPYMKILVVEDQVRLGEFLKQCLSERSYTVVWVRTCAKAQVRTHTTV